jgi:hypothetical protein
MSTIDHLPSSRDVAAEIAKHVAEARRLRTLLRTLRRLELEQKEKAKSAQSGGEHATVLS